MGLSRNVGEITTYSADIAAPLCAPAGLTFWGWLRVACAGEGELFAGAALMALCIGAAMWGRMVPADADLQTARTPGRLRSFALRASLAIAFLYSIVTLVTIVLGPWRIEVPFRMSSSSADKPASVTLFFLLAALLLSRRLHDVIRRGSTTSFYLLCAAVCWVFALGPFPKFFGEPVLYQAPYSWLMLLPGAEGLRVPARLMMMIVLCLIVATSVMLARLLAAQSHRGVRIIGVIAAFGLVADGWTTIGTASVPEPVAAGELQGRTVLFLPIGEIHPDIAAVYRAVTQGFRTINGYSGYFPAYYEALRTLAGAGDGRLFGPFITRGDLDVVVDLSDTGGGQARSVVEQQPGARLVSGDGRFAHYVVPSRHVPALRTVAAGMQVPVQGITSLCSPERLHLLTDGDVTSAWGCGVQSADHLLVADLGAPSQVGAIVHALGSAGGDFPRQLRVETSLDGTTWSPAWEGSPAAQVLYAAMKSPRETRVVVEFPARTARYVRLVQQGRHQYYPWSIAELEVWSGGS
jgi:hypothetical protein